MSYDLKQMWRIKIIILAGMIVFPARVWGAPPDSAFLLQQYKRWMAAHNQHAYKARIKVTAFGTPLPEGSLIETSTYQTWHDGKKWKYLSESETQYPEKKGSVGKSRDQYEWVFPAVGLRTVIINPKKSEVSGVVAKLKPLPENEQNGLSIPPAILLEGRLTGLPKSLPEALGESKIEVLGGKHRFLEEKGPEQLVWGLASETPWGHFTVWLDPALDYFPRKMEGRTLANHRYGREKHLGEIFGPGRYRPRGPAYSGINTTLDMTKISKGAKGVKPAAFTLLEEERFANGAVVRFRSEVVYENLVIGPEAVTPDPFIVSTPIKDGTPVQVDDSPGIEYEWRQGQIVKALDHRAIGTMGGSTFLSEPWWKGNWIKIILIVLVVSFIVSMYFYRQKKQMGKP